MTSSRTRPCVCRLAAGAPLVSVLLLALAAAAPASAAAQQEEPKPPILAVTGEGSVQVEPERARLRVGVVTEARTAREASAENARRMERVVDALQSAGLPDRQIQTVQLTVEPVYDYERPEGGPVLRAFRARNVVEATTPELERLGEILDAVIAVGGNTVENVAFELADPGAAQADAIARAVADAGRKAEALAQAAGLRLGPIQEISTAPAGGPPIPLMTSRLALEAAADAAPPVSPGELTVSASVQVVYRLE